MSTTTDMPRGIEIGKWYGIYYVNHQPDYKHWTKWSSQHYFLILPHTASMRLLQERT